MITIENLTKYYGKNRAVNNISFTINDNEILGFLGPNGAGKSTTMNMIAGFLPMTSGSVNICGYDITKDPVKAKRNIGYLPEIPPVYPDMRVCEYLSFCAGLKRIPVAERSKEIKRVSELLKITDVSKKLIKNLSKGYKQRVGFAQALLGNPKFLILDEPTVGLDPNQLAEVRSIITDLKKEHSVIFSSHILSEVSAVCDRVVIVNKGDIKAIDTIENLEKSANVTSLIHIKIKGDRKMASSVIAVTDGVKEIKSVNSEGNDFFEFVILPETDTDEVRSTVMTKLIENKIQIVEIFTEKPDLEDIFIKMINQTSTKKGLSDLMEEYGVSDESENADDKSAETAPEEKKEADE